MIALPPNIEEFLQNPKWQRVIVDLAKIAKVVNHGEVTILIQDKNPVIVDYKIKRKPEDLSQFQVVGLE